MEGNIVFNIVMFFIAIVSIGITIYFAIRSRKDKKPSYVIRTINLIRDTIRDIDSVKILYKTDIINNLSISNIALWNDGRETINSNDVASLDPIKIVIEKEYDILYADFLYKKNEANNFKYEIASDKKTINITFDYFDFEEGFILQVFHTGNSSFDMSIKGSIKTVKEIIRKGRGTTKSFSSKPQLKPRRVGRIFFLIGIFSLLFTIISSIFVVVLKPWYADVWIVGIPFMLFGIVYIIMGYKLIKRKIPKGFDIFEEEFLAEKKIQNDA